MAPTEEEKDEGPPRHPVTVTWGIGLEFQASLAVDAPIPAEHQAYRPEYLEALTLLAEVCEEAETKGCQRPILVGGGAVEYHTRSAYLSGDFDLVAEEQQVIEEALLSRGFSREDRPGHLLVGLYHPDLDIGVQFVSGRYFDGKGDETRVQLVEIVNGNAVAVAPIEDLIADRLGQYVASGSSRNPDLMVQAAQLYKIAFALDEAYLDRRIREDTLGELSLVYLKEQVS